MATVNGDERNRARLRVLVVDDQSDLLYMQRVLLESTGYTVFCEESGEGAIAATVAHKPHAILLDITLSDKSGYEVCKEIRLMDGGSDILMLAHTGHSGEEERKRVMESGFDQLLTKPVSIATLEQILDERLKAL